MKSFQSLALVFASTVALLSSCNLDNENNLEQEVAPKATVTVIHPQYSSISVSESLMAYSSYQKKNQIISSTNGVLTQMNFKIGDRISKGQVVAVLQTKESNAISKLNLPDSLKQFSGTIKITAVNDGLVTLVQHQQGEVVQEGDLILETSDLSSLVFKLSVPYESHDKVIIGKSMTLLLPDGNQIQTTISKSLYEVDVASQTENLLLIPTQNISLPENLAANVMINSSLKENAQVVPKEVVLSNETLTEFWVMKVVNDSTAIQVLIEKGIENDSLIEILSPEFLPTDELIEKGNFVLEDSALISISKN